MFGSSGSGRGLALAAVVLWVAALGISVGFLQAAQRKPATPARRANDELVRTEIILVCEPSNVRDVDGVDDKRASVLGRAALATGWIVVRLLRCGALYGVWFVVCNG